MHWNIWKVNRIFEDALKFLQIFTFLKYRNIKYRKINCIFEDALKYLKIFAFLKYRNIGRDSTFLDRRGFFLSFLPSFKRRSARNLSRNACHTSLVESNGATVLTYRHFVMRGASFPSSIVSHLGEEGTWSIGSKICKHSFRLAQTIRALKA